MIQCRRQVLLWGLSSLSLLSVTPLMAANPAVVSDYSDAASYTNMGGHGLLQMPSARFGQAGDFAVGWTRTAPYRFLTFNATPFPWLEAAVRYTRQGDRIYALAAAIGSPQDNVDKGIDIKARLLKESVWLPQVAVGIRDLGGTGLFGSEYLVATKRINSFDISAGIGWGLLGTRSHLNNPVTHLGGRFEERTATTGLGGTLGSGDWFSGESVSLFGGVEYQTPIAGLIGKIEYDGNDYSQDSSDIVSDSPWNAGVVYRLNSVTDLHLGYERGNTLAAGVVFRTNFAKAQQPVKSNPVPSEVHSTKTESEVISNLERTAFTARSIDTPDDSQYYQIAGSFNRYPDDAKGLKYISRETLANLDGRDLSVVSSEYGMEFNEWQIPYEIITGAEARDLDQHEVASSVRREDPRHISVNDESDWQSEFSVQPGLSQSFQSPEAFWTYRLKLSATGEVVYKDATSLSAEMSASILTNYDKLRINSGSNLPQVRTRVQDYFRENRNLYFERLQATHFKRIGRSWYTQVYAGHLERMFSGFGGEVLYRPFDSWWSVGVDFNRVWQRKIDSFEGVGDYVVNTGHVSANFDLPWDGIRIQSSYGRYLAGDDGLTMRVSRLFDTGFEIGGWATKTDVSSAQFGEGSFDKGLFMQIPVDLFTVTSTRGKGLISWRPIQRDGGQKLSRKHDLFEMTRDRGRAGTISNWNGFIK